MTPRLLLLLPALSLALMAHELEVTTRLAAPAVIVRATYAGTDPVPFAKIQIFSPSTKEFQAGNMDQRGYFAFVPEGPGPWRAVVDDELGHKRDVTVQVPDSFTTALNGEAGGSLVVNRWERALLGIALLLAATGFWYGFQARSKS